MSGITPTEQSPGPVLARPFRWIGDSLASFCLASLIAVVIGSLTQVSLDAFSMIITEAWRAVFDSAVIFDPQVWQVFLPDGEPPELGRRILIVWSIRLPWVFVVILVDANLTTPSAIFQVVTQNELTSLFILGVSSGAGLLILLTFVVFPGLVVYLPLLAALGGMLASTLVYLIAWKNNTSPVRLVLAGVIVDTVFQSLQTGLFFFIGDIGAVQSAAAWTTRSLTGIDWEQIHMALPWPVIAVDLALGSFRQPNILLLGEQTTRLLRTSVEKIRFALSGVAVLAAVASIAVAGIVGFVDLAAPHLMRSVVSSNYKRLVVSCLFTGPAPMVAANMGARPALDPIQLPVGIVTGLVDGPYSLYLIHKQQGTDEV